MLRLPEPPGPELKVFKTEVFTMLIGETPELGGFSLKCLTPAVDAPLSMVFNSQGITIEAPGAAITITPGGLSLKASGSVTIDPPATPPSP